MVIDPQTGLDNATGFQTLVQSRMAKLARIGPPSLIDTTRIPGGSFHATDMTAHFSIGDFAACAPEADSHHADFIIDRCRNRMACLEKSERWPFHLRVDDGYAQVRPDHPETLEQILQRARVMNVG
jgi:hypothetical protein